jgi:hypothetical protein
VMRIEFKKGWLNKKVKGVCVWGNVKYA